MRAANGFGFSEPGHLMILATAGHIDHGKTALVRALTGVDADRLPEEKQRGMTIDLGFAYGRLPDGGEIGFVDVPGHERFLSNMLAGILAIDRVLLVVAADDGPRPQTIEHLDILELIEVAEITGVVTKTDRAGPERSNQVMAELAAMLAASGHPQAPIFAVSNVTGEGFAALLAHLQDAARSADTARAATRPRGLFRMAIDRAFILAGVGLVVTGTIAAGEVAIGDQLMLSPRGVPARVRGLHTQNRAVASAAAGERCALNLAGDFPVGGAPRRGDWLAVAERHQPARRIDLLLSVSRHASAPLRDGLPVHLHLGTADVVARAAVLDGRALAPGDTGFIQVELDEPIAALYGDRVILRDHAARQTLAGGRVIDPQPPRRGRRLPARLAVLQAMTPADPTAALQRVLAATGVVYLGQFALVRNLAPAELAQLTENAAAAGFVRVGPPHAAVAVTAERLATLAAALVETLSAWHRAQPDTLGQTRAALLAQLRAAAPEPALDAALARLAAAGSVVREGGMWRLPEHRPRLAVADEKLWLRVRPLLAGGGVRPPRVRELAAELGIDPATALHFLRRAERLGLVAKIADNRFYLPEPVVLLVSVARELAAATPEGTFTAAAFNAASGVGRNLTIQILEYLDKIGATRRIGDARIVVEAADASA
jgi:selenocysteine-specific elongation factor